MTNSQVITGNGDHHVVALHGWFGSARGWGSLPDYLDGSAFTYAFMDLRGYGDRKQVPGDFTMAEVAADAIAFADDLAWDTFSLVGHSMSGQAIQHVLLQAPARVRRLVGLNPVPAVATPFDEDGWGLFSGAAANRGNQAAVKVIVGEHDPALSAAVMEQTWLAFYPNAELEVLANAGHYPMFETPVALATSIEEFLGRA
ncbi:MAG: alpha/beta hydrolase [Actinomycetota bacterium]